MFMIEPKYRIKKGDTLTAIAAKTGFTVAEIAENCHFQVLTLGDGKGFKRN